MILETKKACREFTLNLFALQIIFKFLLQFSSNEIKILPVVITILILINIFCVWCVGKKKEIESYNTALIVVMSIL